MLLVQVLAYRGAETPRLIAVPDKVGLFLRPAFNPLKPTVDRDE
jgi:hypothetical protein